MQQSVNAAVPVAVLSDALQLLGDAKHVNYSLQQVLNVVTALNKCVEAALRDAGSGAPLSVVREEESAADAE